MAVVVPVVSTFDKSGITQATKSFNRLGQSSKQLGSSLKSAFLPAAAAVAGLGAALASASKAAMEDQASQVELARSVRASTKATNKQIAQMEKFISKTSLATGVADDELRPALARLTRGTGSLTKAQKLLTLAQDIATATGKPLTGVADALSRAFKGNMTALGRLSPEVKKLVKEKASLNDIIKVLNKNFGGATAAAADTVEGRFRILKVAVNETKEAIGYAFLPVLEGIFTVIKDKVLPYVDKLVTALEEEGLSGALKTAGSDLKDFVQNAEGVQGTLINLAATVGIVYAAVKGATGLGGIVSALTGLTTALTGFGGFLGGWAATTAATLAGAFAAVFATIYLLVDTLRDPIDGPAFIALFRNVAGAIGNVFVAAYKGIRLMFNQLADLGNFLTPFGSPFGKLGDVDWFRMDYGNKVVPPESKGGPRRMATGGIVTRPTIAMVGEAGPEAVIPLNRAGGMGMGTQINVTVTSADPNAVVDALRRYQLRNGSIPVKVS